MADFTPRVLHTNGDRLTAYDHGAHVASWVRHGVPVVWVSERSHYETGVAIRGGMPVCWPWFAAGPSGELSPSHGFLRTTCWRLHEQTPNSLRWRITHADLQGGEATERFPHNFECELDVRLDEELRVSLTVRNSSGSPFDFEAALHTYLHVADAEAIAIKGLSGVEYHDKVNDEDQVQDGDVRLTGETDRIYHAPGPVTVHDPVLGRDLSVHAEGTTATVIWNPWAEKAGGMSDMSDDEWRRMVCVEAAALGPGRVRLEPGQEHTVSQRIGVAQRR